MPFMSWKKSLTIEKLFKLRNHDLPKIALSVNQSMRDNPCSKVWRLSCNYQGVMVIKHISYDGSRVLRNRNLQRDKSYNTRPDATITKFLNSYNYVIEPQTSSFHTLCFPVIVCFPKWEFLNQKIKEDYIMYMYLVL